MKEGSKSDSLESMLSKELDMAAVTLLANGKFAV